MQRQADLELQGGPSPGRLELDLSLRAQIDPNDPDLRHEADRYIRPGQFPCSEAGSTLCSLLVRSAQVKSVGATKALCIN